MEVAGRNRGTSTCVRRTVRRRVKLMPVRISDGRLLGATSDVDKNTVHLNGTNSTLYMNRKLRAVLTMTAGLGALDMTTYYATRLLRTFRMPPRIGHLLVFTSGSERNENRRTTRRLDGGFVKGVDMRVLLPPSPVTRNTGNVS